MQSSEAQHITGFNIGSHWLEYNNNTYYINFHKPLLSTTNFTGKCWQHIPGHLRLNIFKPLYTYSYILRDVTWLLQPYSKRSRFRITGPRRCGACMRKDTAQVKDFTKFKQHNQRQIPCACNDLIFTTSSSKFAISRRSITPLNSQKSTAVVRTVHSWTTDAVLQPKEINEYNACTGCGSMP